MFLIKGQNFGFHHEFIPLIISGRKYITSRVATPFRKKLIIGGKMHCFDHYRTANCHRIGTGIVKEKIYWWLTQMPTIRGNPMSVTPHLWESPLEDISWQKFAYIEGFDSYEGLYNYFTNHPKRKLIDEVGLILFVFDFSINRKGGKR